MQYQLERVLQVVESVLGFYRLRSSKDRMRAKPGAIIVQPCRSLTRKFIAHYQVLARRQRFLSSPSILLRPLLGLSNQSSVRSPVMAKRKLETGEQKLTAHDQPQKAKKHKRNHEVLPVVDDIVTERHVTPAVSGSIKSAKAEGENTIPNREVVERLEELKRAIMEEVQREEGTLEANGQMTEKGVLQEGAPTSQKKKRRRKHKHKEDSRGRNENGKDDDQAQRHLVLEKASKSTEGQEEKKHKRRHKDGQGQKWRLREDDIKDNSGKKKGQSAWRVSDPIAGHLGDLDPVFSHDEK